MKSIVFLIVWVLKFYITLMSFLLKILCNFQLCFSLQCKCCFANDYGQQRNQSTELIRVCIVWVRYYMTFKTLNDSNIDLDALKTLPNRLIFGGSMPHYFYKIMEKTLVGRSKLNQMLFFASERLIYTPMFQALSLFFLSIFEVRPAFVLNSNTGVYSKTICSFECFRFLGQESRRGP